MKQMSSTAPSAAPRPPSIMRRQSSAATAIATVTTMTTTTAAIMTKRKINARQPQQHSSPSWLRKRRSYWICAVASVLTAQLVLLLYHVVPPSVPPSPHSAVYHPATHKLSYLLPSSFYTAESDTVPPEQLTRDSSIPMKPTPLSARQAERQYPRTAIMERTDVAASRRTYSSRIIVPPLSSSAAAAVVLCHNNNSTTSCDATLSPSYWPFEKTYYETCTYSAPWHTIFYPTCNTVHEIDLLYTTPAPPSSSSQEPRTVADDLNVTTTATTYSDNQTRHEETYLANMNGSWRSVWFHRDAAAKSSILKLLHLHSSFDPFWLQHHAVTDGQAMERLTASPYIIKAYGLCGATVVTEYAPHNVRLFLKHKSLRSLHRLKLARNLARGLRDIHQGGDDNSSGDRAPTLAHNDVNIANLVQNEAGQVRYNDFNLAVLVKSKLDKEGATTTPCGYPPRYANPLWRAPEDIANVSYIDAARADVYALGNLLFQVLTAQQPWTHLEPHGRPNITTIVQHKLAGHLPHLPAKFVASTQPALLAVRAAMTACYRITPELRPTARQLADGLEQVNVWIQQGRHNITYAQVAALFAV